MWIEIDDDNFKRVYSDYSQTKSLKKKSVQAEPPFILVYEETALDASYMNEPWYFKKVFVAEESTFYYNDANVTL